MVKTYYLHYPLLPVEVVFEIQFLILLNSVVNCIRDVEEPLVAVLVKHLDLFLLFHNLLHSQIFHLCFQLIS